jgi:transcriptional regulator with XRE-family HTH domain
MSKNVNHVINELSPARRKKVEARAAQLIAEEMTLQELRRARKLTQVRMAKKLGIGQDGVSKLEQRADLMISTLRKTVEAMGGRLSLVAEFPDRDPVVLSGVAGDDPDPKPAARKPKRRPRIAGGNCIPLYGATLLTRPYQAVVNRGYSRIREVHAYYSTSPEQGRRTTDGRGMAQRRDRKREYGPGHGARPSESFLAGG